jgi:hypothetical protein
MIKTILITAIVGITFSKSDAQSSDWDRNSVNIRIGPEVAFATGNLNKTQGVGLGGSALLDLPILNRMSLIVYAGALSIAGDKIAGQQSTKYTRTNIYPLRTGINYKFTPNFYGGVQLGQATVTYLGNSKGGFSQSLGIGYFNRILDLGLRWDHQYIHGGLGTINLKAGYVISFRTEDNLC